MQRIKLNERQILMLKKLEQEESNKNKVLRITESQYNRLFNSKGKASQKLSKNLKKAGIGEGATKKIDLVDFAEEIVVFIKDILSNPRTMSFSPYWEDLGISKNQLFNMVKKQGLLALADDNAEIKEYIAPKFGFRKNVKELYKNISEKYTTLNEFGDGGYPAGAEMDPNNPWDQEDGEEETQVEIISLEDNQKKFKLLYMEPQDGLGIFKAGNELFIASLSNIGDINEDPEVLDGKAYVYDYKGKTDNITPLGFEDYINDSYNQGKLKPVRNDKTNKFPVPTLITPTVKKKILEWYGDDPKVAEMLGQLPETTGAASSGAFVGGASFNSPINKDTGKSPEEAMGALINDGIDADGVIPFHSDRNGEEPFVINDITWEYVNADYNGKVDIGVYRYGQDITYSYDWFNKNILKSMGESTTTTSVGGDSGTFAYDAPAGDGKDFWTAGNKLNKGKGDKQQGTPIVRGGTMVKESDVRTMLDKKILKENIKVGQVYKNGLARRKVKGIQKHPLTQSKKIIIVQQWGDGDNREIKIDPKEWGSWDLLIERVVLRVTEAQFNKIMESENLTKTAYPNGDMIKFDDCTKLNNNKVAQNGGCSQGDDGVVKLSKTKGSVVAEGFNPNIAPGSIYAIEIRPIGAKIGLTQDNGQTVVIHFEDVPDVIKLLSRYYESGDDSI